MNVMKKRRVAEGLRTSGDGFDDTSSSTPNENGTMKLATLWAVGYLPILKHCWLFT
jgi:hypothetical protein